MQCKEKPVLLMVMSVAALPLPWERGEEQRREAWWKACDAIQEAFQ